MPDYSISVTLRSIWTISRIFFDVAIMWLVIYYAIKFVRNNSRMIQIFKGIILILIVNGLARLLGLTTVSYFFDMFINWGFLAIIITMWPCGPSPGSRPWTFPTSSPGRIWTTFCAAIRAKKRMAL